MIIKSTCLVHDQSYHDGYSVDLVIDMQNKGLFMALQNVLEKVPYLRYEMLQIARVDHNKVFFRNFDGQNYINFEYLIRQAQESNDESLISFVNGATRAFLEVSEDAEKSSAKH